MSPSKRMRYYPGVGPAIPQRSAGCSRVTHPFAGYPVLPQGPRDLHVLSTPPAFVLSQDQTLQWIVRISSPNRCHAVTHDSVIRNQYLAGFLDRSPQHLRCRGSARSPRTRFSLISVVNQLCVSHAFPRQPLRLPPCSCGVKGSLAQLCQSFRRHLTARSTNLLGAIRFRDRKGIVPHGARSRKAPRAA